MATQQPVSASYLDLMVFNWCLKSGQHEAPVQALILPFRPGILSNASKTRTLVLEFEWYLSNRPWWPSGLSDVEIGGKLIKIIPVLIILYEKGSTPLRCPRHQEGEGTEKQNIIWSYTWHDKPIKNEHLNLVFKYFQFQIIIPFIFCWYFLKEKV